MSQQSDAEQPLPPVVVTIFDQPYRLRSGRGDEHLRRVASLVDERMREVAAHMRSLDMTRIAVLAALNLADELESLRDDRAREEAPHDDTTRGAAPYDESTALPETIAPAELRAGGAQAQEPEAVAARRSWFEDIFEADDETATTRPEAERRLSTEISSKLRPRRRD